jgi:O-antigen/teichoic acid export membrane protein
MSAEPTEPKTMAAGGAVLSVAMLAASAANYLINAMTGRWFDEQGFADASLVVTLFLLGAVAFQLMASRRVAMAGENDADVAVGWLRTSAWRIGLAAGAMLVVPAGAWHAVFSTRSPLPFVVLGLGLPVYLVAAVDRGVLQGRLRFASLSATFVIEAMVRVIVTAGLAAAGVGATGVAAALSVSFVATWAVGRRAVGTPARLGPISPDERAAMLGHAWPVAVLLVGQILINNADVLVVKAWLPEQAAAYAAIALIGRAVFFCSWSVVSVLFPVSAREEARGGSDRFVTLAGVGVIVATGGTLTVVAALAGEQLLATILGPGYTSAAPLLWKYAFATTLFTVTNLLASLDLARGQRRGPRLVAGGAAIQTIALVGAASSLDAVVSAQVVVMALLTIVVVAERATRGRSALHPVADPAHGAHVARTTPVDLLPEVGDVDIDDMVVAEPVRTPHAFA